MFNSTLKKTIAIIHSGKQIIVRTGFDFTEDIDLFPSKAIWKYPTFKRIWDQYFPISLISLSGGGGGGGAGKDGCAGKVQGFDKNSNILINFPRVGKQTLEKKVVAYVIQCKLKLNLLCR